MATLEKEILLREGRAKEEGLREGHEEGLREGREERSSQMRSLYLAMKRDDRRDEYDKVMEANDFERLEELLDEYGLSASQ